MPISGNLSRPPGLNAVGFAVPERDSSAELDAGVRTSLAEAVAYARSLFQRTGRKSKAFGHSLNGIVDIRTL
jgi:hypothetical protein